MSWSVNFIGAPENIEKALHAESSKLSGASKAEFDEAMPNIVGLLRMNFSAGASPVMHLTANGHAHDQYSNCAVTLCLFSGGTIV